MLNLCPLPEVGELYQIRIFRFRFRAGDAVDMVKWFKDNTTPVGSKAKQENPDLIERGIFVQTERPEYCNAL